MTSINVLDLPPSVQETLIKVNLDTVEDLLLYTPPAIADDGPSSRYKRHQPAKGTSISNYDRLMGLTADEITLAYDQASAYVFETRIAYGTALDLYQEEDWLTLGDDVLDRALGGSGIMTRGITEIAGESAVGKTQFCLQLCLTAQLPKECGGLDGSVVWLSTEGKFPYSRLETMIHHFVTKYKDVVPDLDEDTIRNSIYFDSMADQETQLHIFNYQLPVLIQDSHIVVEDEDGNESEHQEPLRKPIKLVIIDSIANNFRSELTVSPAGAESNGGHDSFRSSILQRSSELCEIGQRLRTLADQHGLAVVCVNQVTDVFEADPPALLPNMKSDPLNQKKPALGLVWENTVNARIVLQRNRLGEGYDVDPYAAPAPSNGEPQRTLSVVFAPWTSNSVGGGRGGGSGGRESVGHCYYRIDDAGVSGIVSE
ncbi:DNA repair protein xrcc3 [Lunasporangiospora selenospora]|uniref:DNA repair protein xrcc3 n=1 Tax=Lunasporangiospora selenospora TaxID=979761 RepID=A0A9P6KDK2_9FUNG|nr:DNA repair protein xrcc3 [Lunasporangiospora selenospora]